MALSAAIMVTLGYLTNMLRVQGKDVVLARVFLKWKSAVLSTLLLELGIMMLFVSNLLGWEATSAAAVSPYGEGAETVALVLILAGWLWFAIFLRLPRRTVHRVRVGPHGEGE